MVHRVLDFPYIASEGPITIWYMIRSAFYDAIVFLLVTYYAIYGQFPITITAWDILVFEVLPPIYNYIRTPSPRPNPITAIPLYLLYRFIFPAIRIYTFITPINTSWALPKSAERELKFDVMRFVMEEHESLFFMLWSSIAGAAFGRAVGSYWMVDDMTVLGAMAISAVIGSSLAAWTMLVK